MVLEAYLGISGYMVNTFFHFHHGVLYDYIHAHVEIMSKA